MASLTIKNIPDELYEMLKRSASAHHRSVNSELIYCLEKTLKPTIMTADQLAETARVLRSRVKAVVLDADEINHAIHQGRE
ncbi:MAG: Arc family DNA-binding protein [Pseudomonadota bacterium]